MRRGFLNKPQKSDQRSQVADRSAGSKDHKSARFYPPLTVLQVIATEVDRVEILASPPANLQISALLDISYDQQASPHTFSFLIPFPKRPTVSELTERLTPLFHLQNAGSLIPAAVRAADETWNIYGDGSIAADDFLRPPPGSLYRVAKIPGKGRGMLAARDLEAGEMVLMESPIIILVEEVLNTVKFLALPKAAIQALLLLHNTIPNHRGLSLIRDIPQHRLLDYLKGVASTNAFGQTVDADGTRAGVIVLAGSLFNHADKPNVRQGFDVSLFKQTFIAIAAVKKGEELTISYNHTCEGLKRIYGIGPEFGG